MRSFFVLGSFIASVLAIIVTSPADKGVTNWTAGGPNTITWTSVSTDPSTFKAILVNPDGSVQIELASSVTTSTGSLTVTSPSGGLPTGEDWKINFMSTSNQAGILAQSGWFNIVPGTAASTGSLATTTGTRSASVTISTIAVPTTLTRATSAVVTNSAGVVTTVSSAADLNPTQSANSANAFAKASGALIGAAGILYAFVL